MDAEPIVWLFRLVGLNALILVIVFNILAWR